MEGYAFVTKEPLLGPVVLAFRVDVPARKEQLWMGEEQDVEAARWGPFGVSSGRQPPRAGRRPFGPFPTP